MKRIAILLLFAFSGQLLAAETPCKLTLRLPTGWSRVSQELIRSSDGAASLTAKCFVLPHPLSDTEFSEYIGEEEPEEASLLSNFWRFKGLSWINGPNQLEWWLMDGDRVIHLILKTKNETLRHDLERTINDDTIPSIIFEKP